MSTNMEKPVSKRVQIAIKELRVVTVEAQEAIWQLAPRDWIGKRKAAISGVATRLGRTFARTWNIAHGRARIIRAEEWIRLNEELAALSKSAQQRRDMLHDISILARSVPPPPREDPRPLGVVGDVVGETGPWGKRGS